MPQPHDTGHRKTSDLAVEIITTLPPDTAGLHTADCYDWQNEMAAFDAIKLLLAELHHTRSGTTAPKWLIIKEWHEDWVVAWGNKVTFKSAKHRELDQPKWSWKNLVSNGGLAHLYTTWRRFGRRTQSCHVSNDSTILPAAKELLQAVTALSDTGYTDDRRKPLVERAADMLLTPLSRSFPQPPSRSEAVEFLSSLSLDHERPSLRYTRMYALHEAIPPLLRAMGEHEKHAEAVWDAVSRLFQGRDPKRDPLAEVGFPPFPELESILRVRRPELPPPRIVTAAMVRHAVLTAVASSSISHGISRATAGPLLGPDRPPAPPSTFLAREQELEALHSGTLLRDRRVAVVTGKPGSGKTTLVTEFAKAVADEFPDGWVFLDLCGFGPETPLSASQALEKLIRSVCPEEQPLSTEPERSELWRHITTERRILLVLDNTTESGQIIPLLPEGGRCFTIVTSRRRMREIMADESGTNIDLETFSREDSVQLLSQAVGSARSSGKDEALHRIAQACRRLPLALNIIGSYAKSRPKLPLEQIATELEDRSHQRIILGRGRQDDGVWKVLSWSYEHLPEAEALAFRLLGAAPGIDIDLPAATSLLGVPRGSALELLQKLSDLHLVDEQPGHRYRMHGLLREYAASLPVEEDRRTDAFRRLFDHYLGESLAADRALSAERPLAVFVSGPRSNVSSAVTDRQSALRWFEQRIDNIVACADYAAVNGFPEHAWKLAWASTMFLWRRGTWKEALDLQRTGLAAAQRLTDSRAQTIMLRLVSGTEQRLEHHPAAIEHAEETVRLAKRLPLRDGDLAHSHYVLGVALATAKQHHKALASYQAAADLFRETGQPRWTAYALNGLSWSLAQTGQLVEARLRAEETLSMDHLSDDPNNHAALLSTLADIHRRSDTLGAALVCYEEALAIYRRLHHLPNEVRILGTIGEVHLATGDLDSARDAWQQALTLAKEAELEVVVRRLERQLGQLHGADS